MIQESISQIEASISLEIDGCLVWSLSIWIPLLAAAPLLVAAPLLAAAPHLTADPPLPAYHLCGLPWLHLCSHLQLNAPT
jgi:hypothetical protein